MKCTQMQNKIKCQDKTCFEYPARGDGELEGDGVMGLNCKASLISF